MGFTGGSAQAAVMPAIPHRIAAVHRMFI